MVANNDDIVLKITDKLLMTQEFVDDRFEIEQNRLYWSDVLYVGNEAVLTRVFTSGKKRYATIEHSGWVSTSFIPLDMIYGMRRAYLAQQPTE